MEDYNSSYTGPEIDAAVGAANTPDTTPASGSSALITSGGVYASLGSKADIKLGVYYAKCDTTAATQVKVISIPEITELYEGLSILVRFTYYQNYNGVPRLQINSLPAKDIRRNSTNDAARYEWRATEVVHLVYTGSYFQIVDGETATTTYYGYTKLSSSTSSTSTSLAATPSAVKEAYDLANGKQDAIAVSGILKGDGAGTISAAAAGTDYQTPLVAGTDYQTPLTFDTAPTQDSTNPVTSGGVYTAIRDRDARADSIFSTVTEITSGGITITPTDDWAGYSYLAITLNTSSTNPANERMALIVPVVLIQFSNWFPVARNGVYGAVQVGRVSNSSQLTFKTDLTSLYVVNVRRVK